MDPASQGDRSRIGCANSSVVVTCDFPTIHDPLDEAMRTQFMCSVNNEAVLKALFKHKEGDLTFAKAVAVAVETEEAAKVAKETVHGVVSIPIHKVEASTRRGVQHHQDQDHTASLRFTEAVISLWDLPTLRKNGPQVG